MAMQHWLVSDIGSERATTGPGNTIVTAAGRTHVVWQDSTPEGYFNRVRTFDRSGKVWSPTVTLNQGCDNHARPILTMDSRGFLHTVLGGHNSPTTHRQSKRPHDTSEWTDPVEIGSGTYPVMACGADDTLYVTLRAADHTGMDLYAKPAGEPWRKPIRIVRRHPDYPGYVGLANGLAFGPDGRTLHLVCDFYESKDWQKQIGLHQAVAYMRSPDGGATWQRADGSPVSIPAQSENMDMLAEYFCPHLESHAPPVIAAGGSLVMNSRGVPFVLFYQSSLNPPGGLILATPDARGRWQQRPLDAIQNIHPGFRSGAKNFTITEDDELHGLIQMLDVERTRGPDGLPTRAAMLNPPPGQPVVWLRSRDGGKTFDVTPAWPLDPGVTQCAFNLERPDSHHRIEAGRRPGLLFFEGLIRYPEKGETIRNKVYWFEADA